MDFHEGQKVWVQGAGDNDRQAIFVGDAGGEFFGGPPKVYVVFTDTREGVAVDLDRVTPRDE